MALFFYSGIRLWSENVQQKSSTHRILGRLLKLIGAEKSVHAGFSYFPTPFLIKTIYHI